MSDILNVKNLILKSDISGFINDSDLDKKKLKTATKAQLKADHGQKQMK